LTAFAFIKKIQAVEDDSEFRFSVGSDIKKYGITVDGDDHIEDFYFVIAEDKNGNQWTSPETFPGCVAIGPYFSDIREQAYSDATSLADRMNANVNNRDIKQAWHKTHALYGAHAYEVSDHLAWERDMVDDMSCVGVW